MSPTEPNSTTPPTMNDRGLALVVYVLYLIAYFTGVTAIIGVIIAHIRAGDADPVTRSHYRFQIRTFWIGILYLVVGGLLSVVIIGIAVLFWWFVWSLVRNIKGLLALNDNRPIENPDSWMFG
jgi:uncharacterized membrane protein